MARLRSDGDGCFPTGRQYPGIADLLAASAAPTIGVASELDADATIDRLPLAAIDTETTGFDLIRGHRVIEIAIVHFDWGEVTARHVLVVDPSFLIPAESTLVHGIRNSDVREMPRWGGVAQQILGLLRGRLPIAYNATFDRGFVVAEMRRVDIYPSTDPALPPAMRSNVDWLDPLLWSRALHPAAKGHKLVDVAYRLDVPLPNAHRALDDAEAAGHVALALLRPLQLAYRDVVRRQREYARLDAQRGGRYRR